jgi:lipoate-protein ligase A
MDLLDLTLPTPAENLALDEALLECAEDRSGACDLLRLWESSQVAVIVGRGSRVQEEVHLDACRRQQIPVLRRCSGGAAVVIGPGCLMYSVILALPQRSDLHVVDHAHRFVLQRIRQALHSLDLPVQLSGTSDLTLNDRKISGNSLRCKRNALLYHGTLLYDLPLSLIDTCLKMPPRRPAYRADRPHDQFLMRVPVSRDGLRRSLIAAWECDRTRTDWPRQRTEELTRDRYASDAWNWQR